MVRSSKSINMSTSIKYYFLNIFSKTNYTSKEILAFREQKPLSKEYSTFIQNMKIYSENSQRLLEFFVNFHNGYILPEKCDAYEPIRESFNSNDLSAPNRWLSQPGCAVYLKKKSPFKLEGVIENNCLAMVWDEKGIPLSINKESYSKRDPYYLSEIKLHIDYKLEKLKSKDFIIEMFNELYEISLGEYGQLKDAEGNLVVEKGILRNV